MKAATPSFHSVDLMPKGVKLLPPECFESKHDNESIKEFLAALEIYFHLFGLKNDNTRALFAKMHLTKLTKTWYDM